MLKVCTQHNTERAKFDNDLYNKQLCSHEVSPEADYSALCVHPGTALPCVNQDTTHVKTSRSSICVRNSMS